MIEMKTQLEIFNELQSALKKIDPNFDNSSSSIDYSANQNIASKISQAYEYAQQAAAAADPDSANLQQLKNILFMLGLPSASAKQSSVDLTVTANNGTIIPAGTQFEDVNNNIWYSAQQEKVEADNTVIIKALSLEYSPVVAGVNEINKAVNFPAITSVTNENTAVIGRNAETEFEIKKRIRQTSSRNAQSSVESLEASLYEITGVEQIVIITNRNNYFSDIDGNSVGDVNNSLNPQSTLIYVHGGHDSLIAETIAKKYPLAENLNKGRESKLVGTEKTIAYQTEPRQINIAGKNRIIGNTSTDITFYRPQEIDVSVSFKIVVKKNQILSDSIVAELKTAIVNFAKGNFIINESKFDVTGYEIGETVFATDLSVPINQLLGTTASHEDLFISGNGNTNVDKIEFNYGQIAAFSENNITVNT